MSDKTVQDIIDKSIKQDVAKQQQNKIQKLQEKVKDIEQNESDQISDMDKNILMISNISGMNFLLKL